jgi:adenylate cyclase
MSRAQFGDGRTKDAAKSFERRILRVPRTDMSRAYLASIYGAEGRTDDARRLWDEIRSINPSFSIERLGRVLPYKDPTWFERFKSGLAAADLVG